MTTTCVGKCENIANCIDVNNNNNNSSNNSSSTISITTNGDTIVVANNGVSDLSDPLTPFSEMITSPLSSTSSPMSTTGSTNFTVNNVNVNTNTNNNTNSAHQSTHSISNAFGVECDPNNNNITCASVGGGGSGGLSTNIVLNNNVTFTATNEPIIYAIKQNTSEPNPISTTANSQFPSIHYGYTQPVQALPEILKTIQKTEYFPQIRHRWNTNEEIAALLIAIDRHDNWLSKEVSLR